jgi:hypothetical protein
MISVLEIGYVRRSELLTQNNAGIRPGYHRPVSQENFRLIRNVCNAFAHAKVPITFKTQEVSAVCADLKRINIFDPPVEVDQAPQMPARDRFEAVCNETMLRLARYSGHDPKFKDETGKERKIEATSLP